MARLRDQKKNELFGGGSGPNDEMSSKAALKETEDELDAIARDMDQLRAQYEMYFMGVERLEPRSTRDRLRARLRKLRELKIKNLKLKYKLQSLQARFISFENYWGRINRQREAGTYYRDKAHVRRLAAKEAEKQKRQEAASEVENVNMDGVDAPAPVWNIADDDDPMNEPFNREKTEVTAESSRAAPSRPSPTAKAAPARPAPTAQSAAPRAAAGAQTAAARPPAARSGSGAGRPSAKTAADLTDAKMQQLYKAYSTAKKRCGEKVDLKYDDMAKSLRNQVPTLMKKTGAASIEFKVVIKKGHAVLKAVPKD